MVLTAAGNKHFCTGPNLHDPKMRPSQDRVAGDAARILRNGSQAVVSALLDCEKPVICGAQRYRRRGRRQHGPGVRPHRRRRKRPPHRAVRAPGVGTGRRRRVPVGPQGAVQRRQGAALFRRGTVRADAHRIGLVNKVVADADFRPKSPIGPTAGKRPTRALAAAKAMLNQALDVDRAAALMLEALLVEQVAATDDVAEGVAAFMERRDPHFRGR